MVLLSINSKLKQKYLIDNLCLFKIFLFCFNYGCFSFSGTVDVTVMLFIFQTPLKNNTEGGLISHYAMLVTT